MSFRRRITFVVFALLLLSFSVAAQSPVPAGPPKTRTDNVRETVQGVEITDPYRWLEDQKSPETRAWIDAQNQYTHGLLDAQPGREQLRERLTQLLKIDTVSTPIERSGFYFFSKRLATQQQRVIYVRKGLTGADEVLVDPQPLSADASVSVNIQAVSKDAGILAYGVRHGGEDEVEVRFLDVKTRKDLPDRMPRARQGDFFIKPDNTGAYYSRYLSEKEGSRIYYHAFGTDPAYDQEIFGSGYAPGVGVSCSLTDDGRYLILFVGYGSSADRTEIYFQNLKANGPITPVVNDIEARFIPDVAGDLMILHTNWKAPKGRVLAVSLKDPSRENWREVVPESDASTDWAALAGGRLLVHYTRNASSQLKIFETGGKFVREVKLPAIGTIGGASARWESPEMFFSFSSFATPTTIYRYDIAKGTEEVWARLNVPIDAASIEVKQVWFESKDKTKVPMFLVYKKGLKLDGSNPTLLFGYGGFTVSITPNYSALTTAWVERGGLYVAVNLRGGSEFGEEWHRAGMLANKQNVFDDFIAAGEWLVANKYTKPEKLATIGGSNGGLLVAATMTQRPDLFRAVVCLYPLIDMVRYHMFSIARYWVPEYGSSEDPAQFKYIYAYSPYHHVKPGTKYPAVLMVSGDGDTRVDPLHARKMAALLQASTGSDKPVLLHYDTKAGHTSGGASTQQQIDDNLDYLTFLIWQLGMK